MLSFLIFDSRLNEIIHHQRKISADIYRGMVNKNVDILIESGYIYKLNTNSCEIHYERTQNFNHVAENELFIGADQA